MWHYEKANPPRMEEGLPMEEGATNAEAPSLGGRTVVQRRPTPHAGHNGHPRTTVVQATATYGDEVRGQNQCATKAAPPLGETSGHWSLVGVWLGRMSGTNGMGGGEREEI